MTHSYAPARRALLGCAAVAQLAGAAPLAAQAQSGITKLALARKGLGRLEERWQEI